MSYSARVVRSRRLPSPSSRGQASKRTGGVRHKSSCILARLQRRGTGKRLQEGFRASWRDVVPRVVELLQRSTPAAFNTSARSCVLLSVSSYPTALILSFQNHSSSYPSLLLPRIVLRVHIRVNLTHFRY